MYEYISHSTKETKRLAKKLARLLTPGDVITLKGDLGSGKTTFTQGMAIGLSISEVVSSPTFTIIKEYKGTLPLYHIDAYRLEYSDEDIGFLEYFDGKGISVVEWPQFIEDFLPDERLIITITLYDEQFRKLTFQPKGAHYEQITKRLLNDNGIRE